MIVQHINGGIEIAECPSVKDLKTKIATFVKLFERKARIDTQGYFTCEDSRDPIRIDRWRRVSMGKRPAVDLGSEGLAVIGEEDMPRMRFRLTVDA